MFILYYLKNFFNLLFFKAFFKYKMSDSFFLVCFIILFSFLCLFFVSIFVTILGRLTIFVFFIFSNFLNLILTLIENWFLKNFFYLIIDLIFFLHRIRFSFFSGVSYYDPLIKIFSQNSAVLKGEVLMDFYNFSNKFIFEDSFNLPVSIFSISSIFDPSKNFYFFNYLQCSFFQILQTQNKIRTFFFYSKKFELDNTKNSSKLNITVILVKSSFFFNLKKKMMLTLLFFFNLCSIDFFIVLNSFQSLLSQNSSSFLKILIVKYFSFLKSCFIFVLVNLENDSFLNYIYVTLYRLSSFNYVEKAEWKNLFNTYDLPVFGSLSYSGFSKYDFFFLFKVTFAYFFIYLNYFLFSLFSFLFFFLKFLYYFFNSFFSNSLLFVNYQYAFHNFFTLFACFFFKRFLKFFKYYKLSFFVPEFIFFSNLPEFDFFYFHFCILVWDYILSLVHRLKIVLSAFVCLIFKIRRFFPFYFLSNNNNMSFNFFVNNFFPENSLIRLNSEKIYLAFSDIYQFSLKNYSKQSGRILISSRIFFYYRCLFLFFQLKIFSFLRYSVYPYDSFFFFKILNFIRFLFLKIFSLIFFFGNVNFKDSFKFFDGTSIIFEKILFSSAENFQKNFFHENLRFLKVVLLINFFFELCLVFLFSLLKFCSKIFNIPNFFLFIFFFKKCLYFFFFCVLYLFWGFYVLFFSFFFYLGFLFSIFFYFFIFGFFIHILLIKLFFFFVLFFFIVFVYLLFKNFIFCSVLISSSVFCSYFCVLFKILFSFFNLYFQLFSFLKSRNIGFLQTISILFLIRNDLKKYEFVHSRFDYLIQNSLNLEFILNNFFKKSLGNKIDVGFLTKFFNFRNVKSAFSNNYSELDKYKHANLRDKFVQLQIKDDLFPEFEYHKYLRLRDYKNLSLFRLRKRIDPIDIYLDPTLDPLKNFNANNNYIRAELNVDVLKFFYQDDFSFLKNLLFFRSVFSRKNLSFFYDDLDTLSNFRIKYNKISPIFRYFYLKREKLKYLFSLYSFGNINYFSFSILMNWLSHYKILRNVLNSFSSFNNSFLLFERRSLLHWNLIFLALIFDCLLILFDTLLKFHIVFLLLIFLCYFYSYSYAWVFFVFLIFLNFFSLMHCLNNIYFYVFRIMRKPFLINFFIFFISNFSFYFKILKTKALISRFGFFARFICNLLLLLVLTFLLFDPFFILSYINCIFSNSNFYFSFENDILFFYFFTDFSFSCFSFSLNSMFFNSLVFCIIYFVLKFLLFRFVKKIYFKIDYFFIKYFLFLLLKLNRNFFLSLISKISISPYCLLAELDFVLRSKKIENRYIKKFF